MELKTIVQNAHSSACLKGFWDKPKEIGTQLMLITSELGEALDADREGRHANLETFYKRLQELNDSVPQDHPDREKILNENFINTFKLHVKDTVADELADALIRICDTAGGNAIDLQEHVLLKMRYNATRARMHGKAY